MHTEDRLTAEQAEQEMSILRKVYSSVELLQEEEIARRSEDLSSGTSGDGSLSIEQKALELRETQTRLESTDDGICQVTARFTVVDGKPCVMRLVQAVDTGAFAGSREGNLLYRDALTGIYNRRFYEDNLRQKYLTAGIAVIDLDDFKLYNDTFGHHAGDIALETAAKTIRSCIRDTDYLVRYGGDELVLILVDIAGDVFARKLRIINSKIHAASVPGYQKLRLSASIGGVLSAGMTVERAVRQADRLMYQAKQKKNTVVTDHDSMQQQKENAAEEDRPLVMIVDDSEMNRAVLREMLQEDYRILEVSSGTECMEKIAERGMEISLVLLDIIMPGQNGLEILAEMAHQNWTEDIPVIMISSADSKAIVCRAYELGAADYISRPFDARIVYRRVTNIIRLYAKQRRLGSLMAQQFYDREKNNRLMINILSQVVESRNGETDLHIRRIQLLTEILLQRVEQVTDAYPLDRTEISMIAAASALHDVGKVAIDGTILNKPGPLTPQEYETMKTHTTVGAAILSELKQYQDEPLVKTAYQICRWHHERYDGKGYPDGLKGDSIPFCAQVVSLADVYDALVSERVYKKAYSHEKAIDMIVNGECGAFHPLLLQCLLEMKDKIRMELDSIGMAEGEKLPLSEEVQ